MSQRYSVLCLSTNFPWPADSGGCIRVDGLLRQLSTAYDVRLLVAREHDPAKTAAIVADVEAELGIAVETFDEPHWNRSRLSAATLWLRSLVVRIPPWIYGDLDRRLLARFAALTHDVDAVVLLQDFTGIYPLLAAGSRQLPVVADKHVVLARPRAEGEGSSLRARLLRLLTRSYERRYLKLSSRVVVTTDEDGRWLEAIYGREPAAILPTGVEVGPPRVSRLAPRLKVGWLSALDVVDNLEGLHRFLDDGWPLLAGLGYELLVAGRNPAPAVHEMTSVSGVTLLGHVESVEDFLAEIDVAVIPLWSGRGIKVKTLTFMAAGVPIAATPMAVEGMEVEDGIHCLIGETPKELAAHVTRLLDDRDLADTIGAAGRRLIVEGFTWESVGPEFVAVVDGAIRSVA